MKLRVEGWRFIPHSFAIVNQFQCLELMRRPEIELCHRDVPFSNRAWAPLRGLLAAEEERRLETIKFCNDDESHDAVYRVSYPFDLRPIREPLYLFVTCETGQGLNQVLGGKDFATAQRASNAIVVTPSNWSRDGLIRLGVAAERVEVVPHGVDPALFHRFSESKRVHTRHQTGFHNRFVFLSVGAMTRNKGIDILLAAFGEIAHRHPEAVLLLKGSDSLHTSEEFFNRYTKMSGLGHLRDRILYHGAPLSFEMMAQLYNLADAYVAPYRSEGFCLPALEAAACGLPIIATAGGSTDDFLDESFALRITSRSREWRDEPHGPVFKELVPEKEHLAHLMEKLIEDESARESVRRAAPMYVNKRFTWKMVVDQLLIILNSR